MVEAKPNGATAIERKLNDRAAGRAGPDPGVSLSRSSPTRWTWRRSWRTPPCDPTV